MSSKMSGSMSWGAFLSRTISRNSNFCHSREIAGKDLLKQSATVSSDGTLLVYVRSHLQGNFLKTSVNLTEHNCISIWSTAAAPYCRPNRKRQLWFLKTAVCTALCHAVYVMSFIFDRKSSSSARMRFFISRKGNYCNLFPGLVLVSSHAWCMEDSKRY